MSSKVGQGQILHLENSLWQLIPTHLNSSMLFWKFGVLNSHYLAWKKNDCFGFITFSKQSIIGSAGNSEHFKWRHRAKLNKKSVQDIWATSLYIFKNPYNIFVSTEQNEIWRGSAFCLNWQKITVSLSRLELTTLGRLIRYTNLLIFSHNSLRKRKHCS